MVFQYSNIMKVEVFFNYIIEIIARTIFKSKIVSFTSSILNKTIERSGRTRVPVNWICFIAFGSASSACCLLKSIVITLYSVFHKKCRPNGFAIFRKLIQFFKKTFLCRKGGLGHFKVTKIIPNLLTTIK